MRITQEWRNSDQQTEVKNQIILDSGIKLWLHTKKKIITIQKKSKVIGKDTKRKLYFNKKPHFHNKERIDNG